MSLLLYFNCVFFIRASWFTLFVFFVLCGGKLLYSNCVLCCMSLLLNYNCVLDSLWAGCTLYYIVALGFMCADHFLVLCEQVALTSIVFLILYALVALLQSCSWLYIIWLHNSLYWAGCFTLTVLLVWFWARCFPLIAFLVLNEFRCLSVLRCFCVVGSYLVFNGHIHSFVVSNTQVIDGCKERVIYRFLPYIIYTGSIESKSFFGNYWYFLFQSD